VYKDSKILFIRRFDIKNFNKEKLIERNKEFEKWLRDEFFKEFLD
ncbi:MAG TPA: HNH endonuclease, partial [Campylobacter avium]|nr:HNH endonuclease [Campylobacter avium]